MSNQLARRVRIAKIFNSFCHMLEQEKLWGGGNCQTIIDTCIDRMYFEWLEAKADLDDVHAYIKRMIALARSYEMAPMGEEALHAMQALGIK